jgi:hypothetical protein
MKHLRLFHVVPSILVIDSAKEMILSANRDKPQTIKSNIIYYNCACATLLCLKQNKRNGINNTPLKELGRDQFYPLQVLIPRIRIKYTSLIGLAMLPQLCIDQLSLPNNDYYRSLDSLHFVCSQSVLFEIREASRLVMHVSPIFPCIFYLMLKFYTVQLVAKYSHDICCYDTSILDPYVPTILG